MLSSAARFPKNNLPLSSLLGPPPLQGTIASRMSHSCTPNCQATVMACDGRLTIAMHTLRQIAEGEAAPGHGSEHATVQEEG